MLAVTSNGFDNMELILKTKDEMHDNKELFPSRISHKAVLHSCPKNTQLWLLDGTHGLRSNDP
jgi:cysteine sulfinate desulfinase/cysteine desulfurase-like protein